MKLCVMGLGYIGLPTSIMFANAGCEVVGVDINKSIIDLLNSGSIHIEEPGLEELFLQQVREGKFRASTRPEQADVFIIAVPTPFQKDIYSCDLSYVLQASRDILRYVSKGNVVIIESTIAPNSMKNHVKPIFEKAGYTIGKDLYLVHCPERVLPGKILHELIHNNRIVGGITAECTEMGAKVYSKFVRGEILKTEATVAELSKCMENTYRDVNIALANELAKVCDTLEIDCLDVIRMANKHPRVNIHQPGPGVGGHCLAIDPYFIYAEAPEDAKLIKLARDINSSMPHFVTDVVRRLCGGTNGCKVAALGATYKGNVDDCRESPALEVIELLREVGFAVDVYDPHVDNPDFVGLDAAIDGADLILVLVDHNEYKDMNHAELARRMRRPMLFDTRNMIAAQPGSGMEIVNYGNMHQYKNKNR